MATRCSDTSKATAAAVPFFAIERVEGVLGAGRRVKEVGGRSGAPPHSQTEEKARWRWQQWRWGRCAWSPRPLTHFAEHVAGDRVAHVESLFGPFPGRFRSWAKTEVRCPRAALHFLCKGHGY